MMRLTRKTRLGDVLEAFPSARVVFEDNNIDLDDMDPQASLSVVAQLSDVDIEELLADLRDECDVDDDDFTYGGGVQKKRGNFDDDDDDDDYDDDGDDDLLGLDDF